MLPTYDTILEAAGRLAGHAVRTPLLRNDILDERVGAKVFIKAENLQRTGSFKFRGAYNAVCANADAARERGIVASSSGNHAQGVAEAARLFGAKATIVMPSDAPQSKKNRTRRSGAAIVEYDRATEDRDALLDRLAAETGALAIHPYENAHVISGQGTVGLEIAEQLRDYGAQPDRAVVCTGGGGLAAGVWLALDRHFPDFKMHTAEPEGHDDQARSHQSGERVGGNSATMSVQDAIVTPMPGEVSFELLKGHLEPGLTVTDEEALQTVAFLFNEMKLVVEPGGAAALAAILFGKVDVAGETVVVTASGGNIDAAIMARALGL